jgi:predicted nucleic acid-binding protein
MIFVDTSVWIDLFRDEKNSKVATLTEILEEGESICFAGVILQEIFQGVESPQHRQQIENSFAPFVEIFPNRNTYLGAAELYRKSRQNGHPIRSSIDCLIAACCIEHDLELLEKDRDFKFLSQVSSLKLLASK